MKQNRIVSLVLAAALLLSLFAGWAVGEEGSSEGFPDGYEEGTSDADSIVNTTAAEKVILVVSFGTSFNQSRSLTIGGIEAAIKEAYPDYQIRRAFTSQIIMDKLAARDNLRIDNVTDAMNRMALDKVKEVIIQPTTVMNGFEYEKMMGMLMPFADKFDSFKIGKWLLADDADYDAVAETMIQHTARYRADSTAIVYMGHGTEHEANDTYAKMQDTLIGKGCGDYLIGTVEGEVEIEDLQETLKEMDVKKVVLVPLMIVAGDHANNDMAGDEEDAWKAILEEDGYEVETVIEGLGQLEGIQELFVRHVQDAIDSEERSTSSTAPAARAAGVTANRIKNGTYPIEVDSDSSMFRIVDCQLTVEDNGMWAVMTLSGQGFSMVYMGTGEQALGEDESSASIFFDNGERHAFTVPVEALDRGLDCAGKSARKEQWYDHMVVFKSASIPADAFAPCQIDVSMAGGSGKASVHSPAALIYKGGADIAEIVWSSPHYAYMLVDGEEYLPVNAEGASAFEIPITLDMDMNIIACTTAMSAPKEIAYTLRFDSASIQ